MTPDFVLKLGWAAGRVFAAGADMPVLIGKDTRISGYMFESALEAGFAAAGVSVRLLGPMPTPAVAYLTRTFRAAAGVVISASHNPFHDNGIKFFGGDGRKLPDETESAIERALNEPLAVITSGRLGGAKRITDAAGRYIEFCKSSVPEGISLRGMKLVIDCANGAAYNVAPGVFEDLGAKVIRIGVAPDGFNINDGCGSTAPQALQHAVVEHGADLGIALDGDGDRVIMVDSHGEIVDGDRLLYIIACDRQRQGALRGPVVGTLMSNLGLEKALGMRGIEFRRAKVGDRHVLEMLEACGGIVGGESSGHIICLDRTTTGDGTIAALQVLAAVLASGRSLRELAGEVRLYPQHLVNVRIAQRIDCDAEPSVRRAVQAAEAKLATRGRVLLRPSGTEPVVRVMVEGEDATLVRELAENIAEAVRQVAH